MLFPPQQPNSCCLPRTASRALNRLTAWTLGGLMLSSLLWSHPGLTGLSHSESLFRASANYEANAPYTPTSLFSQPIPHAVGDLLTIIVNESTVMSNSSELTVERSQNITENSSGLLNRVIHKLGVPQRFAFPDFNGLATDDALESSAEALRNSQLQDTISVQVVQVLPNNNLVVQGTKTVLINKDRVNMIITGIVNPFYLNQQNEINSTQVANFQILMGGKGVITRQQNDSIFRKVFQLFN